MRKIITKLPFILVISNILILIIQSFLLFFLTKNNFSSTFITLKGHFIPWILAIIIGVFNIVQLGIILNKLWTNKKYMIFLIYLLIWWCNVLMVVFSILDFAGQENYIISAIFFIVTPIISIPFIGYFFAKLS